MKGKQVILTIILITIFYGSRAQVNAPALVRNNKVTQLLVHNNPYLILGGELGNSSASSNEYMRSLWPKLKKLNLNTVIAPVYWEFTEPQEGRFDFSLVDSLIKNARSNGMKLVLLWFGAWKNSMSCYAPEWIKTDPGRFPRAVDQKGESHEILSPFSKNNLEADKNAFSRLLRHIKEVDGPRSTVIALQVENEIGMLPDARTYDHAADSSFHTPVPEQLTDYLRSNRASLAPELRSLWEANGSRTKGTWEDVFGKSLAADEIFMAWFYGRFANELARAGKAIYNLPMYVNAALNRPGMQPGQYPSAGPLPHLLDIWKAAAPSIDLYAPDFYNPDFRHWCDLYTGSSSGPLFIPEIRFEKGIDAKAFFAFGHYNCLSFSPFSIESTEHPEKEPIAKAYAVLGQLIHLITKYQPSGAVSGFLLNKDSLPGMVTLGHYQLTVRHDYTLGWSDEAKADSWPAAGGIVISTGPDEFYVAGTGIVVTFESIVKGKHAGFLSVDEGSFRNQQWVPGRRMNGDQDHQGRHVRIPAGDYGIQHVRMYTY